MDVQSVPLVRIQRSHIQKPRLGSSLGLQLRTIYWKCGYARYLLNMYRTSAYILMASGSTNQDMICQQHLSRIVQHTFTEPQDFMSTLFASITSIFLQYCRLILETMTQPVSKKLSKPKCADISTSSFSVTVTLALCNCWMTCLFIRSKISLRSTSIMSFSSKPSFFFLSFVNHAPII